MAGQKKNNSIVIITIIAVVAAIALAAAATVLVLSNGGNKLEKHLSLGQKYLKDGDYEEAIAEFEKALEIDPMCVEAYRGITDAYMELGDYEAAMEVLEEALELFEEDGSKSEIRRIKKLIEEVEKAEIEENGTTDSAAAEEPAEDYDGNMPETAETAEAAEETPADNRQILEDYYNNLISRDFPVKTYEVFTMACKYSPEYEYDYQGVDVAMPLSGYINYTYFDFDSDGEDELVITSYTSSDSVCVEVIDVESGMATLTFLCNIYAGLCGGSQQAEINIGLCRKNGELYMTVENETAYSLFADGIDIVMQIYKVSGNTATKVFDGGFEGSDFSDTEESDQFREYKNSLKNLGFERTANALTYEMKFAKDEGITSLVTGISRHSSTYDQNYDYDAFWNGDPNPDPGEKAFIFTQNRDEGYSIINNIYPTWWWY